MTLFIRSLAHYAYSAACGTRIDQGRAKEGSFVPFSDLSEEDQEIIENSTAAVLLPYLETMLKPSNN